MRTLNQTTVIIDTRVDRNDRRVVIGTVELPAFRSYAIMRVFAKALKYFEAKPGAEQTATPALQMQSDLLGLMCSLHRHLGTSLGWHAGRPSSPLPASAIAS